MSRPWTGISLSCFGMYHLRPGLLKQKETISTPCIGLFLGSCIFPSFGFDSAVELQLPIYLPKEITNFTDRSQFVVQTWEGNFQSEVWMIIEDSVSDCLEVFQFCPTRKTLSSFPGCENCWGWSIFHHRWSIPRHWILIPKFHIRRHGACKPRPFMIGHSWAASSTRWATWPRNNYR